jgi:hypothetical protein
LLAASQGVVLSVWIPKYTGKHPRCSRLPRMWVRASLICVPLLGGHCLHTHVARGDAEAAAGWMHPAACACGVPVGSRACVAQGRVFRFVQFCVCDVCYRVVWGCLTPAACCVDNDVLLIVPCALQLLPGKGGTGFRGGGGWLSVSVPWRLSPFTCLRTVCVRGFRPWAVACASRLCFLWCCTLGSSRTCVWCAGVARVWKVAVVCWHMHAVHPCVSVCAPAGGALLQWHLVSAGRFARATPAAAVSAAGVFACWGGCAPCVQQMVP